MYVCVGVTCVQLHGENIVQVLCPANCPPLLSQAVVITIHFPSSCPANEDSYQPQLLEKLMIYSGSALFLKWEH